MLLTTFLTPVVILFSFGRRARQRVKEYFFFLLLLETAMLGAFVALDLFLFYVFWELMLIPMYFIIGIWGGARRIYASFKFLIYTLTASLLMLVAILYLVAVHCAHGADHLRPPPLYGTTLERDASSSGCSRRSRSPSRSRCRCSRCTPGCPTRTSRRRPAAR